MSLSRSELEQAARKMFDAYAAVDDQGVRDLDDIISLFAPDVAYEMPFAPNPISLSGTQALRTFLAGTQGAFVGTQYALNQFTIDTERQTVVVEAKGSRRIRVTGETAAMRYVFVLTFRDGKISQTREYVFTTDQDKLMRALKPQAA